MAQVHWSQQPSMGLAWPSFGHYKHLENKQAVGHTRTLSHLLTLFILSKTDSGTETEIDSNSDRDMNEYTNLVAEDRIIYLNLYV